MKEQELQAKIIKYLHARGGYVVKVITATKAGTPDIIACLEGQFYGIEVKVGCNKASPLQLANLRQIAKAGGTDIIAYSLDDVIKRLVLS